MPPLFRLLAFFSVFFWLDAYHCIYKMIRNVWRRKKSANITKFSSMHIAHRSMFNVRRSSTNSGADVLRCVIQTGTVTHLLANYECGFILFIETVKWWIRNSFYTFSILFFPLFCISLITTMWKRDFFFFFVLLKLANGTNKEENSLGFRLFEAWWITRCQKRSRLFASLSDFAVLCILHNNIILGNKNIKNNQLEIVS